MKIGETLWAVVDESNEVANDRGRPALYCDKFVALQAIRDGDLFESDLRVVRVTINEIGESDAPY